MKIATTICTLRRPRSLDRTLSSLAGCAPPRRADWSVVVVDNSGCAETQRVATSFRERLPIQLLVEPKVGLAQARNAAVAATTCDYFIWTDDDVTVGDTWLRDYEDAFERHPEAAFFGGPIRPRFEGSPPPWIAACLPNISTAFAGRDLAKDALKFDRNSAQLPFGANLAIRAAEQYRFRYDVTLGRQPGPHILSGEESDCLVRICASGGIGFWVPSAGVEHWIDADRQSASYLRRYYTGISLAMARAQLIADPAAAIDRFSAQWQLLRSEALYLLARLAGRPQTWMKALRRSAQLSGQLAARRELAASGRNATGGR